MIYIKRKYPFEAITRLGRALAARQPLVLLLDDWHWADSFSHQKVSEVVYAEAGAARRRPRSFTALPTQLMMRRCGRGL